LHITSNMATPSGMATFRLEDLPDELIVKVFSFLEIRDLICLGQLSIRIRAISHDEQFWQKINLYHDIGRERPQKPQSSLNSYYRPDRPQAFLTEEVLGGFGPEVLPLNLSKSGAAIVPGAPPSLLELTRIEKIPARFLKFAINNGCKYLSLCPNRIDGNLGLDQGSSLIYLKLQKPKKEYFTKFSVSEELLLSCHSLQKLSMNSVTLPFDGISTICNQNGKTLQILDLNGCKIAGSWELKLQPIQVIVRNCTNLKEVNFDSTILSDEAIEYLVENITPSIELLSLNYVEGLYDDHIKILVNRCLQLKTLNLAHTLAITSGSLNAIIENLKPSLERLDISEARLIDPMNLLDLRAMPKLQILIGSPPSPIKEQLQNSLPNLVIYDFGYNEVDHLQFLNTFTSAENLLNKDGIWEIKAKPLKLFSSS
jgi:hypothetical protein